MFNTDRPLNILITGATGFIGQHLVNHLQQSSNARLSLLLRSPLENCPHRQIIISSINDITDWQEIFDSIDIVIHLAALAHKMSPDASIIAQYKKINTNATINLAQQAAKAGVKRFIFLSTIKVLGEKTEQQAFFFNSPFAPQDAYAQSKALAEKALAEIKDLQTTIIRPPLVYGPQAKGNLQRLSQWLSKGIPLPLAGIKNKRSLVSIDNLCDLICQCCFDARAAHQTFHVSDLEDCSSSELIAKIASSMQIKAKLFYIPAPLLKLGCTMTGRMNDYHRLYDSLQVDCRHTMKQLGWQPKFKMQERLNYYLKTDD